MNKYWDFWDSSPQWPFPSNGVALKIGALLSFSLDVLLSFLPWKHPGNPDFWLHIILFSICIKGLILAPGLQGGQALGLVRI